VAHRAHHGGVLGQQPHATTSYSTANAPVRVAVEANGMPHALEVTTEAVRVLAHEICNPIKRIKQNEIPVALKTDIANLYLHGLEGRWGLKPFQGITSHGTAPFCTVRSMSLSSYRKAQDGVAGPPAMTISCCSFDIAPNRRSYARMFSPGCRPSGPSAASAALSARRHSRIVAFNSPIAAAISSAVAYSDK
jgi:hypothetical protein